MKTTNVPVPRILPSTLTYPRSHLRPGPLTRKLYVGKIKNQANQMLREKRELEKQIKRLQERLKTWTKNLSSKNLSLNAAPRSGPSTSSFGHQEKRPAAIWHAAKRSRFRPWPVTKKVPTSCCARSTCCTSLRAAGPKWRWGCGVWRFFCAGDVRCGVWCGVPNHNPNPNPSVVSYALSHPIHQPTPLYPYPTTPQMSAPQKKKQVAKKEVPP